VIDMAKGEYTPEQAARVNEVIDQALRKSGAKTRKRQPSAGELAGMLGNAIQRWPDDFDGGLCDEISHIIDVLDQIDERTR
jgi:hypothetical protein